MSAPPPAATHRDGRRHLVLVGAGRSHQHLLERLARQPVADLRTTLLHPSAAVFADAGLVALIAGRRTAADCSTVLGPLLQRAGVSHLARRVLALDTASRTLALDDGQPLVYDLLSVDGSPVQDRAAAERALPGAREHGLFLLPAERFAMLWPQVTALAPERLRSIAVVGAGPWALEAALAIRHRLPAAAVSLVTGGAAAHAGLPAALGRRVLTELARCRITVLPDRATALQAGEVLLACGGSLVCDVPVLALPPSQPAWLAEGGLACDDSGHVQLDTQLRSTSHPEILLAPALHDCAAAAWTPQGAARRARHHGDTLVRLLLGNPLRKGLGTRAGAPWICCGDGAAIVGGHAWSVRSRWLARWLSDLPPAPSTAPAPPAGRPQPERERTLT